MPACAESRCGGALAAFPFRRRMRLCRPAGSPVRASGDGENVCIYCSGAVVRSSGVSSSGRALPHSAMGGGAGCFLPSRRAGPVAVLGAEYSSTFRRVLECFAESTIRHSARHSPAFRIHKVGNVDAVPARNARFRDKKRTGGTILRAPHGKTIAWCRRDKIRTYFCRWDRCGDCFGTDSADNVLLTLGL